MTISRRDRRALVALAVALAVAVVVRLWPQGTAPRVVAPGNTVPAAEQRLARVRELAAQLPAKQKQLQRLQADLKKWEQHLIQSDTGQQAQAQLLQVLREVGARQEPPLDFRSVNLGQIRPLGQSKDYGEALVAVTFDCAIEQLVNLLADLTAQPQAIVTEEIRILAGNEKQKTLRVRLTLAGLVPAKLVPRRKGLATL